jgi:hypothetical protein
VPAVSARERALRLRLELIVELLHHALLQLRGGRLLRREELRVDERGELADLHRRALHPAKRLDHLLRGVHVPLLERLRRLVPVPRQVAGTRARVAGALRADDGAHLRRPADAAPGDVRVVGHSS